MHDGFFAPRMRVVTGKGGVGKSTVACALALAYARRGQRVLLCEVNAPNRQAELLQVPAPGYAMREVRENLFLCNVTPEDAIREYALMTLKMRAIYNAVFENRLVRYFLRFVPSLAEYVSLGKIWFHWSEGAGDRPRFDTLIVDAPATGHALTLLKVPQAVVDSMPAGPLVKAARDMLAMLHDERTVLDIVTLPEEMPVNEAAMLERAAHDILQMRRGTLFVNMDIPPVLSDPEAEQLRDARGRAPAPLQPVLDEALGWHDRRLRGEDYLERLPAASMRDAVRLPLVPRLDLAELERLSARLGAP